MPDDAVWAVHDDQAFRKRGQSKLDNLTLTPFGGSSLFGGEVVYCGLL